MYSLFDLPFTQHGNGKLKSVKAGAFPQASITTTFEHCFFPVLLDTNAVYFNNFRLFGSQDFTSAGWLLYMRLKVMLSMINLKAIV